MASGSTLPPQAYTREILTAAFNWLQTQSDSVRRQATNPDSLVGLYMRAQRMGESVDSDAPISSQNFMSDLKNLAEGLKQFETPASSPRDPRRGPTAAPNSHSNSQQAPPSAPFSIPHSGNLGSGFAHQDAAPPQYSGAPRSGLNERTLAMIHEVKNQLNLSSDTEAINMMISLAYKSLKNLLA